jgi:hypothetical protein
MGNDLSKVVNIGKDTEKKLKQVGINTSDELRQVGSQQVFMRLRVLVYVYFMDWKVLWRI